MEQEKNLKDEIIGAVGDQLRLFKNEVIETMKGIKTDIVAEMDIRFREQGILLETMQDDIDTLVDGQEILHEKIDRLDTRVVGLEHRMDRVEV